MPKEGIKNAREREAEREGGQFLITENLSNQVAADLPALPVGNAKRLMPLYLATTHGKRNLSPQMADSSTASIITQSVKDFKLEECGKLHVFSNIREDAIFICIPNKKHYALPLSGRVPSGRRKTGGA